MLDWVAWAVMVGGAVAFAHVLGIGRRWEVAKLRVEAAQALRLQSVGASLMKRGRVWGTLAGLAVEVKDVFKLHVLMETITVELPESVPRSLSLSRAPGDALDRLVTGPDIATGDPAFDARVRVRGVPSAMGLAVLDAATRERLLSLIGDAEFTLGEGRITRCTEQSAGEATPLAQLLLDATIVARALDPKEGDEGTCDRLVRNACEDPVEGFRGRSLEVLCDAFPGDPRTQNALRGALSDHSPAIRLQAARALGAEGVAAIEELLTHRACPDHVAVAALESLLNAGLPREGLLLHLVALLDSNQTAARRLAIERLGLMGHTPAIERIVALLNEDDADTAATAARALGRLAGVVVVPDLHALAMRCPTDRGLCEAVAEAVRAIQSRVAGAEAGQVSVVASADAAGAVSLAEPFKDERGRVSLGGEPAPCAESESAAGETTAGSATRRRGRAGQGLCG